MQVDLAKPTYLGSCVSYTQMLFFLKLASTLLLVFLEGIYNLSNTVLFLNVLQKGQIYRRQSALVKIAYCGISSPYG